MATCDNCGKEFEGRGQHCRACLFKWARLEVLPYIGEIMNESAYTCICGERIEPDGECGCGAPNPLMELGLI